MAGEYRHHTTGVRLRVNGSGNLLMYLHSLDEVRTFTILPLAMQASTDIEPTRLANFRSQRTKLEIRVDEIDEYFKVSKIVFFMKKSANAYPG